MGSFRVSRFLQRLWRFIRELRRRNVYKVAVAYLAVAFVGLQAVNLLIPATTLPSWADQLFLGLLILGFPVSLVAAWAFEMTPEGVRRTSSPEGAGGIEGVPATRARMRAARWLLAVGALAAMAAGGWYLTGGGSETESEAGGNALAVLPFDNLSGDPVAEPFVKGMTEQLIMELSKLSDLTVISRTSVMRYEDTDDPMPEIARELGADVMVEGSVMKTGDEVRITVQLIDAVRDRHLWANDYRRALRNVLDLQSEVARRVAREIGIELTPEEERELEGSRIVDPAAHEAYLRGLYHFRRGGPLGSDDSTSVVRLRQAVRFYREAIGIDPEWAEPHAHLASTYHWLASSGIEPERLYSLAKESALRAIKLDESDSQAHASLGFVLHRHEWDFAGARQEYRRAMELNPNAYPWHIAFFQLSAGEYEESIENYRRAIERNPLSIQVKTQLALAYYCATRERKALDQLDRVTELDSGYARAFSLKAEVLQWLGRHEEAMSLFQRAADLRGVDPQRMPRLGVSYAATGRRDRAREVHDAIQEEEAVTGGLPELQLALGDTVAALRWLERAVEQRDDSLLYIRCRRWLMDRLGEHPRFRRLVARIGFPES